MRLLQKSKNGPGDLCVTCFSQSSWNIKCSTPHPLSRPGGGSEPRAMALTLQGSLSQSLATLEAFPLSPSPWWFLAPCEGGYFLTGGPCSWFRFVAAVSPIQLHILGFPPGILGAPLVCSLPYSRIPRCQIIIYWALTCCQVLHMLPSQLFIQPRFEAEAIIFLILQMKRWGSDKMSVKVT